MSGANILTPEEIMELKNHPIDFSDIPEITDEQAVPIIKPNVFGLFLAVLFLLCPEYAEASSLVSEHEDTLEFKAAVFSPGDEIFIWWGHAALIVSDTKSGEARIFDWGIFSYDGNNFLQEFINDRVRYKCGTGPVFDDIRMYMEEDRDITLYTLNLEAQAKRDILAVMEHNVLPENCYYIYHQFNDNCSTRIRDFIDIGTGGQMKEHFSRIPGRGTYRYHVRRYVQNQPASEQVLDLIAGPTTDVPISQWEEMFLPTELADNLSEFSFIDSNGQKRKLVTHIETVHVSQSRSSVPDSAPSLLPRNCAAGLALAAVLILLDFFGKKYPAPCRFFRGIIQSLLGLLLGIAGIVLVFTVFLSGKDYVQYNSAILYINPLLLGAVPLGIYSGIHSPRNRVFSGKLPGAEKILSVLWTLVFAAGIVSLFLNLCPPLYQNHAVLGFVLPPAFVLSSITQRISAGSINNTRCGIRRRG